MSVCFMLPMHVGTSGSHFSVFLTCCFLLLLSVAGELHWIAFRQCIGKFPSVKWSSCRHPKGELSYVIYYFST